MSRPLFTYAVDAKHGDRWVSLVSGSTWDFCTGFYLAKREGPPPRLAFRVVRDDGKVCDESTEDLRAGLGQVAGFPTAEQHEAAAQRALDAAAWVREKAAKRAAREGR